MTVCSFLSEVKVSIVRPTLHLNFVTAPIPSRCQISSQIHEFMRRYVFFFTFVKVCSFGAFERKSKFIRILMYCFAQINPYVIPKAVATGKPHLVKVDKKTQK